MALDSPLWTAVSIHAPSGERSDCQQFRDRTSYRHQVSIHAPSGERSDACERSGHRAASNSFNPRPPPERGATVGFRNWEGAGRVSIHAPLRREERHGATS